MLKGFGTDRSLLSNLVPEVVDLVGVVRELAVGV